MASIADITVYDGADTPVSHTLAAISVVSNADGSVEALYREALASVPAYANVEARIKLQTLKSGVSRVETTVSVPVMESVTGQNSAGYTAAPKVAYVNRLSLVGFFHQRSTVADRKLAKQILTNLTNNISTSVAAATSGPVPLAFNSLVAPT
jgi:hypothetical protein